MAGFVRRADLPSAASGIAFGGMAAIVRADPTGRKGPLKEDSLFITPAFAQAAGATAGAADILMQVAPFGLILVIMYFLIMRPQQKRAREQAEMIKNVRRGDTIVMTGGLMGKVSRVVDDGEVELEIAPNVKVRVVRSMIADVRAKGEPVKEGA